MSDSLRNHQKLPRETSPLKTGSRHTLGTSVGPASWAEGDGRPPGAGSQDLARGGCDIYPEPGVRWGDRGQVGPGAPLPASWLWDPGRDASPLWDSVSSLEARRRPGGPLAASSRDSRRMRRVQSPQLAGAATVISEERESRVTGGGGPACDSRSARVRCTGTRASGSRGGPRCPAAAPREPGLGPVKEDGTFGEPARTGRGD